MSLATTLASSALGTAKKAYLLLHKRSDIQGFNTAKAVKLADEMLSQAAAVSLGNIRLPDTAGGGELFSRLEVQYNPSSLAIYANAESIPFSSLQQNIDNGIPNQNIRAPSIALTVDLIFDALNLPDAFMADKLRVTPDSLISDAAALTTLAKGCYSVQPQTNGLVALMLRSGTRLVTFRWGDLAFTGQVTEVKADYTMFSVSGRPIRSNVRLNIIQQVESAGDSQYWDKAFDNWFKTADVSGKGVAQKVGNILNLGAF